MPYTSMSSLARIHLVNDHFPESNEKFNLSLKLHGNTSNELNILPFTSEAVITITDTDSSKCL